MADKKDKKKQSTGAVQPLDAAFAMWLERAFHGGDKDPTAIDVYPLLKKRDRLTRLFHYDVKANEKVSAERAVELANEIYSECQLHCDALRKREQTYEVNLITERIGGLANPVGHKLLTLTPRAHAPAPTEGEEETDTEDGEPLTARKMILESLKANQESVKLIHERDRFERENEATIVGDTMIALKGALVEREKFIVDLIGEVKESNKETRESNKELRELIRTVSQQRVEERAVAIDEANAAEDRRDRAAARERDNIWADVTRAGMLEGVKVLGTIFPGIGQAFLAHMTGKPIPDPPQLDGAKLAEAANGTPQLPAVPEEKVLVDRFIAAAESHRIDSDHTAAEKIFGKDDELGKPLEPGVFTREQVAILSGVHTGTLSVDALDALLPDSGKAEAIAMLTMVKAAAFCTPAMIKDVKRFMELRVAARTKKTAN